MADNNKRSYIEEIRDDQKLQGLVAQALGVKDESDFAIKVSDDWAKENKYEDNASDTLRHIILGGLMQSVPGEGIGRIGKGIARKFINYGPVVGGQNFGREGTDKESLIDIANNDFGRVLRQQLVDKENTSVENFVDAAKNVVTNLLNNKRIEVEGLSPELSTAGQRPRLNPHIALGGRLGPRLSPGALGGKSTKFQKGGANMAETEELYDDMGAQMELAGLVSEPTDKDPVSGNDIPLGATAEGVRDDQTAAISPGEFVIPDYAVRFHGLDFYVESLQKAQQGLQQMEGMGLVGNPDDQTIPDEAPLPVMSDATGNEEMVDTEQPAEKEFQTGGLTTTALPQIPQQQVAPTAPLPQAPVVQPLRPVSTQPIPTLQPPASAPQAQYGAPQSQYLDLLGGTPGGYDIEQFVNDSGNIIHLTTYGGKVQGGVPTGYRKVSPDATYGAPGGTISPLPSASRPSILPEVGSGAETALTALSAVKTYSTINKLTGGALNTNIAKIIKEMPGGQGVLDAVSGVDGSLSDVLQAGVESIKSVLGISPAPATSNIPLIPSGVQGLSPGALGGGTPASVAADTIGGGVGSGAIGGGSIEIANSLSNATNILASGAPGAVGAATQALSPAAFTAAQNAGLIGPGGSFLGTGAGAAGAATLGSWLGTIAPPMAAIMAIPTVSNMLNPRSKNRLEAAKQAGSAVERSLLNPDFNENNAARIRALTGLKGDTGQYGDIPSEGRVSSIGGALNRIQQAGGVDAIPSAAGKAMYNELLKEIERQELAKKRESLGVSSDEREQYARLSPEEVEREYRYRQSGNGNGG